MKARFFILFMIPAILISQPEKELLKAIRLYEGNNYEQAKDKFEELIDKELKLDSLYYYAGLNYLNLKEYEEAVEVLETAVKLKPKDSNYYFILGNAYGLDAKNSSVFSQLSLAKKCKNAYLKAVELNPENINAQISLANYYSQAPGIAGGDTEKSFETAKLVVKKDEKKGRILLANFYLKEGEEKKAENEIKILESKFANDSTIFSIYNTYGYYLLKQNRPKEAVEKFLQQVKLAPNNANAYDSLGDGYLATGDKKSARNAFKKALEIDPDFTASKEKLNDLKE